jgi:hypothetical protein
LTKGTETERYLLFQYPLLLTSILGISIPQKSARHADLLAIYKDPSPSLLKIYNSKVKSGNKNSQAKYPD